MTCQQPIAAAGAGGSCSLAARQRRCSSARAGTQRALRQPCCAAAAPPKVPLIKVCGVTRPEEALHAARAGANLIGMILWPGSKRSVKDFRLAAEIAAAAREGGAEPVGVFVDESPEQIVAACDAAGVTTAQLHGDAARLSLAGLPPRLRGIYVMTASPAGALTTPLPGALIEPKKDLMAGAQGWRKAVDWVSFGRRTVEWLLVDGQVPGSGEAYDWRALRVPRGASRRGWLLAGGLTPENVGAAMAAARPDGVDVASGVTRACGVLKDPARVEAFVAAVRAAAAAAPAAR